MRFSSSLASTTSAYLKRGGGERGKRGARSRGAARRGDAHVLWVKRLGNCTNDLKRSAVMSGTEIHRLYIGKYVWQRLLTTVWSVSSRVEAVGASLEGGERKARLGSSHRLPHGCGRWYAPSPCHLRSLVSDRGRSSCGRFWCCSRRVVWCCSCRVCMCVPCFSSYRPPQLCGDAGTSALQCTNSDSSRLKETSASSM